MAQSGSGQDQDYIPALNPGSENYIISEYTTSDTLIGQLTSSPGTIGIGLNPLRTIIYIGYELQIRGALTLFSLAPNAEIAFPVQYLQGEDNNIPYRVFFSEATYRRYFNKEKKRLNFSGGIRYAYIEGELLDDSEDYGSPGEHTGEIWKQSKFGIYGGLGYRYRFKKGWYLGSNIIVGPYFGSKTPYISSSEDFALNFILGFHMLEIGYSF